MFLSFCYTALRWALQFTVLCARSGDFKELEIVVLRLELAILAWRGPTACHDAGHVGESSSAEGLAFRGGTAALIVAETNPARTVRGAKHAVLLPQVVNDVLLLAMDPAGE